jgi:ubiquitin C-terminal hydrolase
VIEHFGTPQFGHYVAAKKDGQGWVVCNDKAISRSEEENLKRRKAYMLFYDKI